jgi:hypothetical protein
MSRAAAGAALTTRYADLHEIGEPVHTWPVAGSDGSGGVGSVTL